jgi:serine/threonine protein kinase
MFCGRNPFIQVDSKDHYYKLFYENKEKLFWSNYFKNKNQPSLNFQNLVTAMISIEPSHRPSLSEIINHPWIREEVPTENELETLFCQLNSKILIEKT